MLPKANRIKKKKDFEAIFKKGVKFKNSLFILIVAKNNLDCARVGFIVSQKVSKKATIRNKIRRRLAESVKIHLEKIKSGVDLVFIVLSGAEKSSFTEIKNTVHSALNKAKLIS